MQVGDSTSLRRVQRPGGPIKHLTRHPNAEQHRPRRGLRLERRNTTPGEDVYETVAWVQRTASIGDGAGGTVFEQKEIDVPATWSQNTPNSRSSSTRT